MIFKGSYLRVSKPITENGQNPVLDDFGTIQYKTFELPITALAELKKNNEKLPKHLQFRIEEVHPNAIQRPTPKIDQEDGEKKKAGRPPASKNDDN